MTPDLSASRIYTDFQGFSDLKSAARQDSPEALREVAQQFEAVFIQMMLKSMRDANLADGIFESDQSEMYLGMFDQQLALDLSSKKAFGIADMLMQQLGGNITQNKQAKESLRRDISLEIGEIPHLDNRLHVTHTTSLVNGTSGHLTHFESPEEFVETMRPLATKAAKRLGVQADVLVAQAALETGWGKKIIHNEDGSSTHNLFGIKADKRWQGQTATVKTLEHDGYEFKPEQAAFRAYASYEQSFNDYVNFIRDEARYENALKQTADAKQYIHALQEAGYATDPRYAEKIVDIMDRGVI